mgnify:CR=1 FL=1
MTITKEEFERRYAEESHVTLAYLRAYNRIALPCDCKYKTCDGWYMAYPNQIIQAYEAGQRQIAELEVLLKEAIADTPQRQAYLIGTGNVCQAEVRGEGRCWAHRCQDALEK